MPKRKVVVTGAAGYVAGRMLPALRECYDLTLLDVRTTNRAGEDVPGVQIADLIDPNRDAYRRHFRGVDAVIHCGFTSARRQNAGASREANYRAEIQNIEMAFNVYQTSLEEGVRRVVVCSSNHAADYYERLIWSGKWDVVTPEMRPLSDNYYGWAKEVYEHLGFVFATGHVDDKKLQNIQIRIGGPRETDLSNASGDDLRRVHRALGAYLSIPDQTQLFIKSIETENIDDENGVPFQIFYGISGNSHNFWSLVNAKKVIGYEPQDNSQVRFADQLSRILQEAKEGRDG
jgi:NAD+ dependent glucose-6-phosphate dehydrogenase